MWINEKLKDNFAVTQHDKHESFLVYSTNSEFEKVF